MKRLNMERSLREKGLRDRKRVGIKKRMFIVDDSQP